MDTNIQLNRGNNFDEAINNREYIKLMNAASKKYRKFINSSELAQIKRIALWKTIQKHQSERSKFETYLTLHVRWGCQTYLKQNFKKTLEKIFPTQYSDRTRISKETTGSFVINVPKSENQDNSIFVREILESLPEEESKLISWYYLEKYTLKEISAKNGFTAERNRKKILKGIKKLQERYGVSNI